MHEINTNRCLCESAGDWYLSEQLKVEYIQDSVTVFREMTQLELADLLLQGDILLLSVNQQKTVYIRKRKRKR